MKPKVAPSKQPVAPMAPIVEPEAPPPNAFLEEAKREKKRKLLSDHIETVNVLRDEKRFTFREIAEWLTKKGIETDHSAVYRAYLAAIPEEMRDPREQLEPWEDDDEVLPD